MYTRYTKDKRYFKRKASREKKKAEVTKLYDDFETVFSFEHLWKSYKKCIRGVSWKASVQRFIAQAPIQISSLYHRLLDGTYRSKGFYEFDICERGKVRHIRSVDISERVVQRCLCDYSLTPMINRSLIYDNGASTKDKGYTFAINRVKKHILEEIARDGLENAYVLTYDFSKFFDNIDHNYIKSLLSIIYDDNRIKKLLFHFIDMFGEKGIGLGSQISQNLALLAANKLDHYIKERLRVHGYDRYMDDGCLFGRKEELELYLSLMEEVCEDNGGLMFNLKKTNIVKLSHGFTWLHVRFKITEKKKIVNIISHSSTVRCRQKLKSIEHFYRSGNMTIRDVYNSFQSWYGYAKTFKSYRTRHRMLDLFKEIYGKETDHVLQNFKE